MLPGTPISLVVKLDVFSSAMSTTNSSFGRCSTSTMQSLPHPGIARCGLICGSHIVFALVSAPEKLNRHRLSHGSPFVQVHCGVGAQVPLTPAAESMHSATPSV